MLGVQHIEGGAAANDRLALHAFKRDFVRADLLAGAGDGSLGREIGLPGGRQLLHGSAARIFEHFTRLLLLLHRLADGGVFDAALEDRHGGHQQK